MGHKKQRIARNMGRIEFIACREKIDLMRSQGYDNKMIHTLLHSKEIITMSYSTLCYHISRFYKHNDTTTLCMIPNVGQKFQDNNSFSINKSPSSSEMI